MSWRPAWFLQLACVEMKRRGWQEFTEGQKQEQDFRAPCGGAVYGWCWGGGGGLG